MSRKTWVTSCFGEYVVRCLTECLTKASWWGIHRHTWPIKSHLITWFSVPVSSPSNRGDMWVRANKLQTLYISLLCKYITHHICVNDHIILDFAVYVGRIHLCIMQLLELMKRYFSSAFMNYFSSSFMNYLFLQSSKICKLLTHLWDCS